LGNTRIIGPVNPPRIDLRFRLVGSDGRAVKEGTRTLTDQAFLQALTAYHRSDPLRYEKALLDDWIARDVD